jgi:hypothetical protein
MKNLITFFLCLCLCLSCASRKDHYPAFYNDHTREADLAIGFPKWLVMGFIDKKDREMVKQLSKGMNKIRLLYQDNSDQQIHTEFKTFAKANDYKSYLYLKDGEEQITLYTKEDDRNIKEIILSVGSEDESILIAILGKMPISQFATEIGPKLNSVLD